MKDKVSVVVSAYNVYDYIEQSLESVAAQRLDGKIELIIVLDAPTDKTAFKVINFKAKYDGDDRLEVKIVVNNENVGAGASRKRGIEASTGEWVLLLDGDDYLQGSRYIHDLVSRAEETGADIVSSGVKILREDGSWDATSYGDVVTEDLDKVTKFWGERVVFLNNKLVRRSMYDLVPYSERRYIEDTPVVIPLLHYANRVAYVDSVGYVYRMRSGSLTHTSDAWKDILFKGLCWLDLMDFFEAHDPRVIEAIGMKTFVNNIFSTLGKMRVTQEMVNEWPKETLEFFAKLMTRVSVKSIGWKEWEIIE